MARLTSWVCGHPETTTPDEHGYAICVRCGAALPVRLTRYIFDKAMEGVLRRG